MLLLFKKYTPTFIKTAPFKSFDHNYLSLGRHTLHSLISSYSHFLLKTNIV